MQKDILFLVTGMTPQIITETLYALAADPENNDKWVPTEIHVLTTAKGKSKFDLGCLMMVFLRNFLKIFIYQILDLTIPLFMSLGIKEKS